jgi:hypothetical protein
MVCGLLAAGVFGLRRLIIRESRVSQLQDGAKLLGPILSSWFFHTFASFATYIYAFTRAWEASGEAYLYAIPFFAAMAFLLYRKGGSRPARRVSRAGAITARAAATAILLLALGYPLSYLVSPVQAVFVTDRITRISMPGSVGSSLAVALLLTGVMRTLRTKKYRIAGSVSGAAFLGGLFLYAFAVQEDYARVWEEERQEAGQLLKSTPDARADSVILVRTDRPEPRFSFQRPRVMGYETYMLENLFTYLYGYGAPVPKLLFVNSDAWAEHLNRTTGGFLTWDGATFEGRDNPAQARFHAGDLILFREVAPGRLMREAGPISVNGIQVVRPSPVGCVESYWDFLRPSPLMDLVVPGISRKPAQSLEGNQGMGGCQEIGLRVPPGFQLGADGRR